MNYLDILPIHLADSLDALVLQLGEYLFSAPSKRNYYIIIYTYFNEECSLGFDLCTVSLQCSFILFRITWNTFCIWSGVRGNNWANYESLGNLLNIVLYFRTSRKTQQKTALTDVALHVHNWNTTHRNSYLILLDFFGTSWKENNDFVINLSRPRFLNLPFQSFTISTD